VRRYRGNKSVCNFSLLGSERDGLSVSFDFSLIYIFYVTI